MVAGFSEDEINKSVERLVEISAATVSDIQAGADESGRQSQGVGVRAPAIGPEALIGQQRSVSAKDISAMSQEEYSQFRKNLSIGRPEGDQGLWG
jgi:hypothetical protein